MIRSGDAFFDEPFILVSPFVILILVWRIEILFTENVLFVSGFHQPSTVKPTLMVTCQ